jgi:Tfp pilus assembly major pilin PilA
LNFQPFVSKVSNIRLWRILNAWLCTMGSEAAAVVVWVCAALFATSVGADTWKRGAGVTVVTVDENFSVGVTAEGGWGLQDGGVSVCCTQPLTRTSTATALQCTVCLHAHQAARDATCNSLGCTPRQQLLTTQTRKCIAMLTLIVARCRALLSKHHLIATRWHLRHAVAVQQPAQHASHQ